ncbi:hypothetical protein D3C72_1890090 [compost metagenome]
MLAEPGLQVAVPGGEAGIARAVLQRIGEEDLLGPPAVDRQGLSAHAELVRRDVQLHRHGELHELGERGQGGLGRGLGLDVEHAAVADALDAVEVATQHVRGQDRPDPAAAMQVVRHVLGRNLVPVERGVRYDHHAGFLAVELEQAAAVVVHDGDGALLEGHA